MATVANSFRSEAVAELPQGLSPFTEASAVRTDVSAPAEMECLFCATMETFARADILANNGPYSSEASRRVLPEGLSVEQWEGGS